MNKIHRVFIALGFMFIIFSWIFQGHIFFNEKGYIILTESPYEIGDTYYYHAINNGNYITIEVPFEMFYGSPITIKSKKYGDSNLDLITYIKTDNKHSIDISYIIESNNMKFSKRQIQLIYDLFDYYMNENRVLIIPNYTNSILNKNKYVLASLVLLIALIIFLSSNNLKVRMKLKHAKIIINGVFVLVFIISMMIVGHIMITPF